MIETAIPTQYIRMARAIQEMEAAAVIASLVKDCLRVLNVGPSWGRDHYALTQAGHQVFNLDVAMQQHLPRFVVANIAQGAPFPAQTFDAVIMAEVLEHLWNDLGALHQAHRVLKDNGRLVVTVPFYHDVPEFHVRLHSPRTIRRLLEANGFSITDYIERSGLVAFPRAIHGLRKILAPVGGDEAVAQAVIHFDKWLGRRQSRLLRFSPGYGCYVAAIKSQAVDFERLNVLEFAH